VQILNYELFPIIEVCTIVWSYCSWHNKV